MYIPRQLDPGMSTSNQPTLSDRKMGHEPVYSSVCTPLISAITNICEIEADGRECEAGWMGQAYLIMLNPEM